MAENYSHVVVIAVDCSVFSYSHGGLASFFRPYLIRMLHAYPGYCFHLVAQEGTDMSMWCKFANVNISFYSSAKAMFFGKGRSLRGKWSLSFNLNKIKADFLFSPYYAFFVPLRYKNKCIITVHDTCFWDVPRYFSLKERLIHKFYMIWNLCMASHILTVSKTSKKRFLLNFPSLSEDFVSVIYNAWPKSFVHNSAKFTPGSRLQHILINAPAKLFLSSGGFSGTKNLRTVLQALRRAVDQRKDLGVVLTGNARYVGEMWQMIDSLDLHSHVFPTGVVSDAEMQWLTRERCTAAICMSEYEGFGRSLVEAMHAGLPLICSDMPTNREIACNYPVAYCNYLDVDALMHLMIKVADQHRCSPVFDDRFYIENSWNFFAKLFDSFIQKALNPRR